MNLPDFLIDHPDGEIRLTGHRISLYHVVDRYQEGYSAEMLAEEYPTLSLALIHKVIAFYLENQAEVDAYMAGQRALLRRQEEETPLRGPTLEEMRARLKERGRSDILQSLEES